MSDIDTWKLQLQSAANKDKARILSSLFKTGKGEYGEGDIFIGVTVPANRAISRNYHSLPMEQIRTMLHDPIHEFRLAGLLALVEAYKRTKKNPTQRLEILNFYLDNMACCNNWDLVDLSSQYIIGEHMLSADDDRIVRQLADNDNMWIKRIAIVSTLPLVRNGRFNAALYISEKFIDSTTDLLHKATGWVLREIGKKDKRQLCDFLDSHAAAMPRTMLRYAIEKFTPEERKHYMSSRTR